MADDQFQIPDDVANTDKPKRQKNPAASSAPKSKKGDVYSADDCTTKYYLLHTLAVRLLGESSQKKEKDFAERGATLSRLSQQYPIVGFLLKMFDPVFFLLGVYNDHADPIQRFRERRKAAKTAKAAAEQGGGVMVIGNPGEQFQQPSTH